MKTSGKFLLPVLLTALVPAFTGVVFAQDTSTVTALEDIRNTKTLESVWIAGSRLPE